MPAFFVKCYGTNSVLTKVSNGAPVVTAASLRVKVTSKCLDFSHSPIMIRVSKLVFYAQSTGTVISRRWSALKRDKSQTTTTNKKHRDGHKNVVLPFLSFFCLSSPFLSLSCEKNTLTKRRRVTDTKTNTKNNDVSTDVSSSRFVVVVVFVCFCFVLFLFL